MKTSRWFLLGRAVIVPLFVSFLALGVAGCASETGQDDGSDDAVTESSDALVVRSDEWEFFDKLNSARRAHGLHPLRMQPGLVKIARAWSANMDSKNKLYHRGNLTQRIEAIVTKDWRQWGENVGVGPTVSGLHTAFMQSPEHRANILGHYNYVGIGTSIQPDGTIWVTVDFLRSPANLATVHE